MSEAVEGTRTINVQTFIDSQRFSAFHWVVFVLGFLIVLLDGFDNGAIAYIAPSLMHDWRIPPEAMGPVFSAGLIGLGFGALFAGQIADRLGRKTVLVGSVFFFGVWSLATAFATSMEALTVTRLLTGLGLGATIPNVVTLMTEYAPARVRGTVVNAMVTGYPVGLAIAGALSAWSIPKFGWRSVLFTGGLAPVLLGGVLVPLLPESAKFLVSNNRSSEHIARLLRRLTPLARLDNCVFVGGENPGTTIKSPALLQLLSRRYRLATTMLWLSYFLCLSVVYLLTNWLPILFKTSGFTLHDSAMTTSLFHVGGCLGILIAGWLMDRIASIRVVALFHILTAVTVLVIGFSLGRGALLVVLVFASGVALSGAAGSMPPMAAAFYPTVTRASGVGWMLAIGRVGAVAGAFGGGMMMARHWQYASIFSLLAVPAIIAAVALLLIDRGASSATSS